jgi:hypothetical protein
MQSVTRKVIQRLRRHDEGGAVLIIFAISAVVIFSFIALAVDISHAFVERRDSQSTADVAAIGGALTLIDNSESSYFKAITLVDEVQDLAEKNLGSGLNWEGCADPDRPSEFTVGANDIFVKFLDDQYTECISWSADWSKVRVKVPDRQVDTFFAGIMGVDSIAVGAFAEVNALVAGAGATLPFGVLESGTNELLCLKTGPKFPSECDPNATGNFGFVDFQIYGNSAMGTTSPGCNANPNDLLKENIAHGVDHDLTVEPKGTQDSKDIKDDITIIKDDEQCPGLDREVMAALTSTGNRDKVLIDGFVKGYNGFPGRLTVAPSTTITYENEKIDYVGLWEWLADTDPDTPGLQNLCVGKNSEALILACIDANKGAGAQLFSDTIATSPRLAVIPILHQNTFPSGNGYVSFKRFQFVYIQGLYGSCDNSGNCDTEIVPGETFKAKKNVDPVVVTAIPIPHALLPPEIVANFGAPRVVTYALSR